MEISVDYYTYVGTYQPSSKFVFITKKVKSFKELC